MYGLVHEKVQIFLNIIQKQVDIGKSFDIYQLNMTISEVTTIFIEIYKHFRSTSSVDAHSQLRQIRWIIVTTYFILIAKSSFSKTILVDRGLFHFHVILKICLYIVSIWVFLVFFPEFSYFYQLIRPYTAVGKAEVPLIANLHKMLKERKNGFQNFNGKTDIVQLLLQQDESRQKNENVWRINKLNELFL